VPTSRQDVLADGALSEQGITGDDRPSRIELPQQGHRLAELVLATADGHLGQHQPATTSVGTEQVSPGQVRAGFGPPHRLAVDRHWLQWLRLVHLLGDPGAQHSLEDPHVQALEHPMQRVQAGGALLEAEHGAAPGLVRSSPFRDSQQAPVAAEQPAAHKREHGGQRVAAAGRTPMVRDRLESGYQRGNGRDNGRHPSSLPHLASDRKPLSR
jgi:hypothetical protein